MLMSLLGEAGAELAAGRPADAGVRYDEAAALALAIPDLLLAIEAQRMAAFCRARSGDRDGAMERGRQALATGQRLLTHDVSPRSPSDRVLPGVAKQF